MLQPITFNNVSRIEWPKHNAAEIMSQSMFLFTSMVLRQPVTITGHVVEQRIRTTIRGTVQSIEAEDGSGQSFNLVVLQEGGHTEVHVCVRF